MLKSQANSARGSVLSGWATRVLAIQWSVVNEKESGKNGDYLHFLDKYFNLAYNSSAAHPQHARHLERTTTPDSYSLARRFRKRLVQSARLAFPILSKRCEGFTLRLGNPVARNQMRLAILEKLYTLSLNQSGTRREAAKPDFVVLVGWARRIATPPPPSRFTG